MKIVRWLFFVIFVLVLVVFSVLGLALVPIVGFVLGIVLYVDGMKTLWKEAIKAYWKSF